MINFKVMNLQLDANTNSQDDVARRYGRTAART